MYFKLPPNPIQKIQSQKTSWGWTAQQVNVAYPLVDPYKPTPKKSWGPGHGYNTPGEEMREILPELFDFETICPVPLCDVGKLRTNLYRLIQHLNDEHTWTREDIANWLETLDVDLTFKARGGDHELADS